MKKNPVQTSTHLRNKNTGHVVSWCALKAQLPYMLAYTPNEAPVPVSAPTDAAPSRVPDIVAVIGGLTDSEFVNSGPKAGYPKVDALTSALGYDDTHKVTGAERDEAWATHQKNKAEAV